MKRFIQYLKVAVYVPYCNFLIHPAALPSASSFSCLPAKTGILQPSSASLNDRPSICNADYDGNSSNERNIYSLFCYPKEGIK